MARKDKSKFSPAKFIQKFFISLIILVLAWTAFQLAEHLHSAIPLKSPSSHSAVELYSNQTHDDLTGLYQQAIERAAKSITLVIYGLTDSIIIEALRDKCEAGIPVHIVCDPTASIRIPDRLPQARIVNRWGDGLMHQKILIIDEQQIWLGSANLTPSSLNLHGNLVVGIDHPELARTLALRAKSMDETGGANPLLVQEITAGPQQVEFWTLPDERAAVERLICLFRSAKKSIKIAMFFWTRKDFAKEALAAAKRGIKVEVVIDEKSGHGACSKIVQLLKNGGIPTTLSTSQGLLHHKFAYIDDTILVNGSANWTTRAFKANDDYFLIINPLTEEQKLKMNQLWEVIQRESE